METLFYIHTFLAVIAIAFAMTINHAIHALIAMVISLLFLAVSMYILSAPLAAGFLVIVYAGAIMVLFLFAIMLIQLPISTTNEHNKRKKSLSLALLVFCIFWGELSLVIRSYLSGPFLPSLNQQGIKDIARALFLQYGFLVELSSMLLLAGLLSAVYVGANLQSNSRWLEPKTHDST